jgi:hypothetical protein
MEPSSSSRDRALRETFEKYLTTVGQDAVDVLVAQRGVAAAQVALDYLVAERGAWEIEGPLLALVAEASKPVAPAEPAKYSLLTTAFKTLDAPEEVPMPDVMVERLWPDKASGLLLGPDKSGKTFYALEEALCLATGHKVLGEFAVPKCRRVLYISEEDTRERLLRRLYSILEGHGSADAAAECRALMATGALTIYVGNQFRLENESQVSKLESVLRDAAIDVLYLDALGKMSKQQLSHDNDAGRLVELFSCLEATGASLRVIHHTSKAKRNGWTPDTGTVRDASGHHAFADWSRSSLLFSRRPAVEISPKPNEVIEVFSRLRFEGSDGAPLVLGSMVQRHRMIGDISRLIGLSFAEPTKAVVGKQLDHRLLARVLSVLTDSAAPRTTDPKSGRAGVTTADVADRAGFGRTQAGKVKAARYLDAAVDDQKAVIVAEGVRGARLWAAA